MHVFSPVHLLLLFWNVMLVVLYEKSRSDKSKRMRQVRFCRGIVYEIDLLAVLFSLGFFAELAEWDRATKDDIWFICLFGSIMLALNIFLAIQFVWNITYDSLKFTHTTFYGKKRVFSYRRIKKIRELSEETFFIKMEDGHWLYCETRYLEGWEDFYKYCCRGH